MLNFNTIDNTNPFVNSITSHGGNFTDVPTSMVATSSSPHSSSSSSVQVQQINLNYLSSSSSGGNQTNWRETVHNNNNPTASIDSNCNRTSINNNLPHSNESIQAQQQKTYLQTTINDDQTSCRPPLNMDNFLHQKGSENVKRFSVNNLLQLANNCRALVDEHRISSGKQQNWMTFDIRFHQLTNALIKNTKLNKKQKK